jgi:hypothetical protein
VLVNTMKGVMKERGILGFYQGLSASLLRQGTYSTIRFATYDFIKEKMNRTIAVVCLSRTTSTRHYNLTPLLQCNVSSTIVVVAKDWSVNVCRSDGWHCRHTGRYHQHPNASRYATSVGSTTQLPTCLPWPVGDYQKYEPLPRASAEQRLVTRCVV